MTPQTEQDIKKEIKDKKKAINILKDNFIKRELTKEVILLEKKLEGFKLGQKETADKKDAKWKKKEDKVRKFLLELPSYDGLGNRKLTMKDYDDIIKIMDGKY